MKDDPPNNVVKLEKKVSSWEKYRLTTQTEQKVIHTYGRAKVNLRFGSAAKMADFMRDVVREELVSLCSFNRCFHHAAVFVDDKKTEDRVTELAEKYGGTWTGRDA